MLLAQGSSSTPTLLDVFISWFPMLLLIAVWVYFILRGQKASQGPSGKSHGEMLEEHLEVTRRQNDLLEQLVKDQEVRLQRLEAAVLGRN